MAKGISKFHQKIGAQGGLKKSARKAKQAKKNGQLGGRPGLVPDSKFREAATFFLNNGGSLAETMRRFGVYRGKLVRFIDAAKSV